MRQLPVEFIPLDLMCLLSPAHDVALYSDRTNPSPRSLSVKYSPASRFFGLVAFLYQFIQRGKSKYNYQGSNHS